MMRGRGRWEMRMMRRGRRRDEGEEGERMEEELGGR